MCLSQPEAEENEDKIYKRFQNYVNIDTLIEPEIERSLCACFEPNENRRIGKENNSRK